MFYFALTSYQYKMTQYNNLNVKLSDSQLNKLKSGVENGTKVTVKVFFVLINFYFIFYNIIIQKKNAINSFLPIY